MNQDSGRYDRLNGDEDEIAYDRRQQRETKQELMAEEWFTSDEREEQTNVLSRERYTLKNS